MRRSSKPSACRRIVAASMNLQPLPTISRPGAKVDYLAPEPHGPAREREVVLVREPRLSLGEVLVGLYTNPAPRMVRAVGAETLEVRAWPCTELDDAEIAERGGEAEPLAAQRNHCGFPREARAHRGEHAVPERRVRLEVHEPAREEHDHHAQRV